MRIEGIRIDNFLSYDAFVWDGFDPHLNLVVGPNAAGKTNLLHALRAVAAASSPGIYSQAVEWSQHPHVRHDTKPIEIRLDFLLNASWERQLLSLFLASVIGSERAIQDELRDAAAGNLTPDGFLQFSLALSRLYQASPPSWAFSGRLVTHFDGRTWHSWVESREGEHAYYLGLDSRYGASVLVGTAKPPERAVGSLFAAWRRLLPEDDRARLDGCLTGRMPEAACPVPQLENLPDYVPRDYGVPLEVERPYGATSPIHLVYERASGSSLQKVRRHDLRSVFEALLKRKLVLTDNVRSRPKQLFSLEEFNAPVADLSNAENLPLYLFQIKNHDASNQRRRYELVQQLFADLTNRQFDVHRASSPVAVPINSSQGQDIYLDITIAEDTQGRSLAFGGAGMTEALYLSTLIAGTSDEVLLLDEPATNLHPNLQHTLMNKILEHSNNQFVIVTHSPSLLPARAISKVSRLYRENDQTARAALDRSEIEEDDWESLQKELRKSTNARSLLFGRAVILFEGETDSAALPLWFEKALGTPLESQGITTFSVDGDQSFKVLVWYLRRFALPWAIVCDGKVIGDPQPPAVNIAIQLKKAGVKEAPDLEGLDFHSRRELLERHGVFTLARTAKDEIEHLPSYKEHIAEANHHVGRSKVRRASFIATNYDCPKEVTTLFVHVMEYLKRRLPSQ